VTLGDLEGHVLAEETAVSIAEDAEPLGVFRLVHGIESSSLPAFKRYSPQAAGFYVSKFQSPGLMAYVRFRAQLNIGYRTVSCSFKVQVNRQTMSSDISKTSLTAVTTQNVR